MTETRTQVQLRNNRQRDKYYNEMIDKLHEQRNNRQRDKYYNGLIDKLNKGITGRNTSTPEPCSPMSYKYIFTSRTNTTREGQRDGKRLQRNNSKDGMTETYTSATSK